MKKVAIVGIAMLLLASVAFAQSSGNFSGAYSSATTQCTDTAGALANNLSFTTMDTTMKVSSGNGNMLIVRPSALVGLLTNVTISTKNGTSAAAQAGVDFQVTVTPKDGQPNPTVIPSMPVTYEDRYVQISTNLFQAIGAACDVTDANPLGCYFTFNETTLGAHSFDWVVTNLSSGDYEIRVTWTPHQTDSVPDVSKAQTCVGPVVLTAIQGKMFNQSSGFVPF